MKFVPPLLLYIVFAIAMTFNLRETLTAEQTSMPVSKNLKWDEPFDGVVHDTTRIAGFVGEYRWLSNFYLCRVKWGGRVYGSAEAAYQSGKYPPAERDIFTTLDPDGAKELSLKKPYDMKAWERVKEQTMREVLRAKFTQHPDLAVKLLATGERYLEETNWWGDKVWGVYQGIGQNLLGKILMDLRTQLKQLGRGKK